MLAFLKDSTEWIVKAVTFDMTPEEKRVVTKALGKAIYRLAVIAAFGIAFSGYFAVADDVDKKIADAVRPLSDEQVKQGRLLDTISKRLDASIAKSLASDIRLYYARACKEKDPVEKDRLLNEIDSKQDQYKEIKGERYGPLHCDAL